MVQIPMEVAETFRRYYTFMQEHVDFQMKRSLFHTKEHCGRVLLFSLLLADREGLSGEEQEILDADALDRFRLGPGQGSLDETYLRTESAKDLTGYAKRVVESWEEGLEA